MRSAERFEGSADEAAEITPSPSARELLTVRAAIVHDWFQGYHGAERTADVMRRDFFAADFAPDVYTFEAAKDVLPPELAHAIVRESRLANLPGIRQQGHAQGRWRYLLPYMPYFYRRLDLRGYDLVISSTHNSAHHVRPRSDAKHVAYCHTPMRYAWAPEIDAGRAGGIRGAALRALASRLRRLDREASQRPDVYVANSTAVRDRIRRFYGRGSTVIHPPVDVGEFDPAAEKEEGSFLWVHRLVPYKHPFVVAEAFRRLPYRLTMVGVGPLENELRRSLPPNVTLVGWTARDELAKLFARSAGFIHIGEEDFGITMVEALAAGTPVVALDRGGSRDIVRPGQDGLLVSTPDVECLRDAVRRLASERWDRALLAERARAFSRGRFVDQMLDLIHATLERR